MMNAELGGDDVDFLIGGDDIGFSIREHFYHQPQHVTSTKIALIKSQIPTAANLCTKCTFPTTAEA